MKLDIKNLETHTLDEYRDNLLLIMDVQKTLPRKGFTYTRDEPKIGRNEPCKCGSNKKYKKCCGA